MAERSFGTRIKHAFNSFFTEVDASPQQTQYMIGPTSTSRPDRPRFAGGFAGERTIISSIYNRLAVDVAGIRIEHVRVDSETEMYDETIKSGLHNCLNVEANLDQAARHFRQDIAMTLFQEGCIAIVPVDTTLDPRNSGNYEIKTMRVGVILQWWPEHVRVRAYNQKKGMQEEVILPKSMVAIVENPFYAVMNEPNSTLQRLIHKLSLMDHVDEISSSGKLDIIVQLPYSTRTETRKNQADNRRQEFEEQLSGSTYGIAYADANEKIIQLNRSVENNLLEQIRYLKEELYNELGLTEEIMNGTADDVTMLNYINRTIEPVMDAVTEAMIRSFLTQTARTQGQTMMYFQDPFKLIPISQLADIIDVFSRNQIVTSNEVRPALGLKPSKEPQANQLLNANMPIKDQVTGPEAGDSEEEPDPEVAVDEDEARLDREMSRLGI